MKFQDRMLILDSQGALRRLIVVAITVNIALAFGNSAFWHPHRSSLSLRSSSSADQAKVATGSDDFLHKFFSSSSSECDDVNLPPGLSIIHRSFAQLESGSDIRGKFVDHPRRGSVAAVAKAIRNENNVPALTPFSAHCLGFAFASMMKQQQQSQNAGRANDDDRDIVLCVGRDPRPHGVAIADAFARGAESVRGARVVYTGLASTPSMFEFCRSSLCDGGVMITASHLPADKNGMKFFTADGGFEKSQIKTLVSLAQQHSIGWYDQATIPPTSGRDAVFCSEWVDWMPYYASELKAALVREVMGDNAKGDPKKALGGLKLVLNSGNGSGGFFKRVLEDLGADVSASINTEPDGEFPAGIPNPENPSMIEQTIRVCEAANADLGILLDTDADRCGLVAPRTIGDDGVLSDYEAINRNRLIALMGVIFARQSPGCTVVTCSVTSEGLSNFLRNDLGLNHVRHVKGYANVIHRAKSLSESGEANAEVAIETSGHCALKENDYLDDGTYTAVKTVGLLAREKAKNPNTSLLSLLEGMKEMSEVTEIRMSPVDGTLESTSLLFDYAALEIEARCSSIPGWSLDRENLEGIRLSSGSDGSFFMLRKSLHDPVLSLQVEASSKDSAKTTIVEPIIAIFESDPQIQSGLNFSSLKDYVRDP
mmetsp:Transcript_102066/g.286183  ORF Transcript_102066/g.286183 Transcript_102066/m.286183 type:complete len:654 (+) Transcript_102066:255-2216(+)